MWNLRQKFLLLVLIDIVILTFGEVANDVKTDVNYLKLQSAISDMQLQFQEHQIEMNKTRQDLAKTKEDLRETKTELAETKADLKITNLQVRLLINLCVLYLKLN